VLSGGVQTAEHRVIFKDNIRAKMAVLREQYNVSYASLTSDGYITRHFFNEIGYLNPYSF